MKFDPKETLGEISHRPYPLSSSPWGISMSWHDVLFMHWPVPEESLRSLIPPRLRLDTFEGSAWLGVVPFRMSGVRPRFSPSVPILSDFPEINLRTYVTADGRPGVWFFSLDAHNPVAVRLARATFSLPYFDAKMSCERKGDTVEYRSVRTHRNALEAEFIGRYRPTGEVEDTKPGSIEEFLTERYCLYAARRGVVKRGDIHHVMWPLQRAEADVGRLRMVDQIGARLPDVAPLLHYAERLDVLAWPPRKVKA
ncbi:MAG: DUF2071 domain-containing protein [Rubrobacter sp.]|nr:DUF2071 domain-containing protein [Rubrobacter sp.]